MKKFALAGGLAAMLLATTAAQAEVGLDVSATASMIGNYVFRGARRNPLGVQADLLASYAVTPRLSLNGYLWHFTQLETGTMAVENDYDVSMTYTPSWFNDLFTVTAGWIYYDLAHATAAAPDTAEAYGSLTLNRWGWNPTVTAYYNYDKNTGTYLKLSAANSYALGESGWNLDLLGAVGFDFGRPNVVGATKIDGFNDALIRTGLSYELQPGLTFGPAIDWIIPDTKVDATVDTVRPVYSVGFAYSKTY